MIRVPQSMGWTWLAAIITIYTGLAPAASHAAARQRLPYAAIDHPAFIPASQADFLKPDYRVIGITSGGVVKAYPAGILGQHGVVLDRLPDGPIAVTW